MKLSAHPSPALRPWALRPLSAVSAAVAMLVCSAAQASSSGVVISQVYGGGGNGGATYQNDFVELFNAGAAAVNLAGWSVQYASATGNGNFGANASQLLALPAVSLQPGQYFLVKLKSTAAVGLALPSADAENLTVDMSGANGKVALANVATSLGCNGGSTVCNATQLGQIVDLVGYGGANFKEGAAAAPVLSATLSAQRANAGCTDTDQNGADFATATPGPRNTSTPLNACTVANPPIVPTCPALNVVTGAGGAGNVSATDTDSIVNTLAFLNAPLPGFTLGTFTAATANGGVATGSVSVNSSVAAGSYAVPLQWANDDGQTATCTLNVNVASSSGLTAIYTIQGTGATSSLDGQTVTTRGVVTKVTNNGFFMQDATGDGLDTTSDGILVFTSTAPTVTVGQLVQVTAVVDEFDASAGASPAASAHPVTELKNATNITVVGSGSITPKVITLPEAFDNELERYEGMLVTINTPMTVSQNYFQGRYGQVTLGANGRLFKPTTFYRPGTPDAVNLQNLNNRSSILLDDGTSVQNVNPTPYMAADNTLRAGDTTPAITGVIDHGLATSFTDGIADYKIHPTQAVSFTRANPRPTAAPAVGGNVRVASFNVLNYFNGNGAGGGFPTSRGADSLAEFNRQRAKIINAISTLNADVVGLMEIENDGSGSTSAIQDLVNGLNAAMGANTYAVVPSPASGFGSDEIKVALIYKPGTVNLVGAGLSDTDPIHNRPPVAQGFALLSNGEKFGVIVNHFKSKRCDAATGLDQDQGDSQGCYNNLRIQQATRLLSFISTVQSHIGDTDIAVIGDINAYGVEDPVHTLTQGGLVNQTAPFDAAPYSYVFDGEAGYLDHALTTASLSPKVTGTAAWHINADEPFIIDYNLEFKQPACGTCGPDYYTATPYKSSDHDPVVIGMNLVPQVAQSISFPSVPNQQLNASAISLAATASSSLPVSYSSLTPSVCTVTAPASVNLLAAGTCSIAANQAGDAAWLAAPQASVSFQVVKASQSITFNALGAQAVGVSVSLTATASSGLSVSYASLTPTVCSVTGNTVQFTSVGTCTVQASQAGDAVYNPAATVSQSFAVNTNGGSPTPEGDVPIGPFWLVVQALGLAGAGLWRKMKRQAVAG